MSLNFSQLSLSKISTTRNQNDGDSPMHHTLLRTMLADASKTIPNENVMALHHNDCKELFESMAHTESFETFALVQGNYSAPTRTNNLQFMLSDLPSDVIQLIMYALWRNDCKELGRICGINRAFQKICALESFWEAVLRWNGWWSNNVVPLFGTTYKECYQTICLLGDDRQRCRNEISNHPEWAPTWDSGLSRDRWYAMVCRMSDDHRRHLLTLSSKPGIDPNAFRHCDSLALKTLPPNIDYIRQSAFVDCQSLALNELPPNIDYIGEEAFIGCHSLALTALPSGLKMIGKGAFSDCSSLALTALPSRLQKIDDRTFEECTALALETIPPNIHYIGQTSFRNCTSLVLDKEGALPDTIMEIENYAFANCTSLALKKLPSELLVIGVGAFVNCTSLELTELPTNLKDIEYGAFAGCVQLSTETVGDDIRRINPEAFAFVDFAMVGL
jgi:hypothetical protein